MQYFENLPGYFFKVFVLFHHIGKIYIKRHQILVFQNQETRNLFRYK